MTTYEEKSQIADRKKKNSLFNSYDEKADRATAYSTWNGICLSWQLIKGPPHLAQLLGVDTDMDIYLLPKLETSDQRNPEFC